MRWRFPLEPYLLGSPESIAVISGSNSGSTTVPEGSSTAESSSDSSPSDAEIDIWSGGGPLDTTGTLFEEGPARSVGYSSGSEMQEE